MFRLSTRSLGNLENIDKQLVKVVKYAIQVTEIDFSVIEGRRTLERQKKLLADNKTQTLKSKHIEGRAVDLMAYVDGRGSWDATYYYYIADAMKEAADHHSVEMRWGAAWTVLDIAAWPGSMRTAKEEYVRIRKSQGRKPFLDYPHFELMN